MNVNVQSNGSDYKSQDYRYTGTAQSHSQKLLEQFRNLEVNDSANSRSLSNNTKDSRENIEKSGMKNSDLEGSLFITFD